MTSASDETKFCGDEELKLFNELYLDCLASTSKIQKPSIPTSGLQLPRFYDKPPVWDDSQSQKLREEARSIFLQRKSQELFTNEELKTLWSTLEEHHSAPFIDEKMINYKDFNIVAELLGQKCKALFTPVIFAQLQQDDVYGRISITKLFHYVMRKTWLRQSRIGLSLYDVTGQGYLTEKDLELYIQELMPTLPHLDRLETSFHSFYVCTAARKFIFFLDRPRHGKVRIVDILASGFLDDLLELREPARDVSDKNWFGVGSSMRVYAQYLNLDEDRNGMLSKAELLKYGTGTLTEAFVERLFQECLTYEGEMDYKAYLDFVLAMENKKEVAAIQYFFRILDIRHRGYLDAFVINYFFREIQKMLGDQDQQVVPVEDIIDEIFDMVKPKDPSTISLQDLIDSGNGDTVVNILIDLNGFYNYENREISASDSDEDTSQF